VLFMVFVFAIGFGFVALALVRISRPDGPDEDGGDDGPPRRGRGGPRPRPGGPEPLWWPQFEREFRAYVSAQADRAPVSGVGS
jgi:hypothetical protein